MRFGRLYPGAKVWRLRLFGSKNTYPVWIEFNFYHFGQKVYHGPFYDPRGRGILEIDNVADYWGKKPSSPLIWGTGGLLRLDTVQSEAWRIWFYSRWGTIGHIDIRIDKRERKP